MNGQEQLASLVLVIAAAVLAPVIVDLPPRLRLPAVVVETALGITLGPHLLGFVTPNPLLGLFGTLGMAFLFFIAGLELDFGRVRGQPLKLATVGWLVSIGLALGIGTALQSVGFIVSGLLIGIVLSTTALGTLVPILRDSGDLDTRFGTLVLAAGTLGELGPILMISVLLTREHTSLVQSVLLVGFAAVAVLVAFVGLRYHPPRIVRLLNRTMHASAQLPVRLSVLVLLALTLLAGVLGLDMILGAFAAGMVVGLVARGEAAEALRDKLDGLGFGFFVPIFFVVSGMKFDVAALFDSPTAILRLPVFLALFLVCRGLPALLYRRELRGRDRVAFGLFTSTALPLVVAICEIGVETNRMLPENAAALVGAGLVSVFLFPLFGLGLRQASRTPVGAAVTPAHLAEPESRAA
ncbi:MAG: cation:proton antiporter [Chloroflexi bacterium]|nr:cation:proton antiporter [Chloroflexota bacterium]